MDVSKLNNDEKCSLLNKHFVPHEGYKFPVVTDSQGKNRHFQRSWLKAFPGLVYLPTSKGGYCKYCVLFGRTKGQYLGILVSRPLDNFHKALKFSKNILLVKMVKVNFLIYRCTDIYQSYDKKLTTH